MQVLSRFGLVVEDAAGAHGLETLGVVREGLAHASALHVLTVLEQGLPGRQGSDVERLLVVRHGGKFLVVRRVGHEKTRRFRAWSVAGRARSAGLSNNPQLTAGKVHREDTGRFYKS